MKANDGLLKAPLKLIGGKTGQMKLSPRSRIYEMIPPGCDTYIEPFLGSGGILMGKEHHAVEIVNDSQIGVINFYRQLKSQPDELLAMCKAMTTKMSRERFNVLRFEQPDPHVTPMAHAAWYYTINKFARNGIVRYRKTDGLCNATFGGLTDARGLLTVPWLAAVLKRIERVEFYNSDYRIFLGHVARTVNKKTIVVLDPPYSQVFTKYNGGDSFDDGDQRDLAKLLKAAPYSFLLTINDNPYIRKLYQWANLTEHRVWWQCSNTLKGRSFRDELIITNY